MVKRLMIALALSLIPTACAPTNISDLVTAMGKDPASVCVHIGTTPWTPEVIVARVNGQNVAASCGNGSITTVPTPGAGAATVTIPVVVTPMERTTTQ